MDAEIKKELVKIEIISEESFREIFEDEEDLYSVEDLKF
jgi:hypothetical protein